MIIEIVIIIIILCLIFNLRWEELSGNIFYKSDGRRLNSLNSILAFGEKYFSRLAIVERCASSENKNMDLDMRKKQFHIKMLSPAKYI